MANQTIEPQPGDVADERGRFVPEAMPGEPVMIPEAGVDAAAGRGSSGDGPRTGTQGAAIEDLADPDADANFPDPSKPVAMSVGSRPDRGRDIPGGGYGDSRDAGDRGTDAIRDEEDGDDPGAEGDIRSGSHVSEDDTKGTPPGSHAPAEHPDVSQPAARDPAPPPLTGRLDGRSGPARHSVPVPWRPRCRLRIDPSGGAAPSQARYAGSGFPVAPTFHGVQARTTCSTVISAFLGRMRQRLELQRLGRGGRGRARRPPPGTWPRARRTSACRTSSDSPAWPMSPCCCTARPAALAAEAARVTLVLRIALRPRSAPSTELPSAIVASQVDRFAWACSRSSRSRARRIWSSRAAMLRRVLGPQLLDLLVATLARRLRHPQPELPLRLRRPRRSP